MEGFLELVEFSIALAGFTSVAVVFAQRKWDDFDRFRIANALFTSLGASFLAAMPIGLFYLQLSESVIWKVESFIIITYILLLFSSITYRMVYTLTSEHKKQLPKRPLTIIYLMGILLLTLHFLTLNQVITIELKGLNYFSIVFLLLMSVFAFVRIIFYRTAEK